MNLSPTNQLISSRNLNYKVHITMASVSLGKVYDIEEKNRHMMWDYENEARFTLKTHRIMSKIFTCTLCEYE